MNSLKPKGSYAYSALAVAILAASSEFAVAQGSESAQSVQLEEVLVTAQRRSQNLQDVAGAISAFSGNSLEERSIRDATDLQFIVPNMVAGKAQGNTAFTIRGVGFNSVGSPAVALHVDGVYQPRASMGDLFQMDVERVEVLRGPQGTLYGRNANAGVVNYISRRPTDEFEGYVRAAYLTDDETRLEGVLNLPISDSVGARLLVASTERDGFIENTGAGPDYFGGGQDSGRLAVDAALGDSVLLQLTATYLERDGAAYPSIAQTEPFTSPGPRAAPWGDLFEFGGNVYAALGANWTGKPLKTTANDPSDSDTTLAALSAIVSWDIGEFTLKSITGYQDLQDHHWSDFDGTDQSIFQGQDLRDSETLTQEFSLTGSVGAFETVVGLFYMDEDYTRDLSITQPNGNGAFQPGAQLSFVTPAYDTETIAVFADVTWNVTDDLRLIAGFRHSEDEQSVSQDNNITADIVVAPGVMISLGNQCNPADNPLDDVEDTATTPRLGAQYDINDNSMVYVNYTEGFKVGGYNTGGTCNDEYDGEDITAWEAGWKNVLMDGAMSLNATAFYYDYTDLQLQQIIGVGIDIVNAPEAEVTGLELESTWRLTESAAVFGSVSFLDAEYTKFTLPDGANPGSGSPELCSSGESFAPDTNCVDVSGNKLTNAPELSVNAGFDVDMGAGISVRADLAYRSEVYLRETNSREERQDGVTILNASISWHNPEDTLRVRLFGTNLLDEEYATQILWAAPTNSRTISYAAPMQYGAEVTFAF
ncbi:MAG: TonB-dependent receptor [Halieaceae bacterium]|nr:TonB-dependent receptor [Halieaceae bacterium]